MEIPSLMDDAASPGRLHGTNYTSAETLGAMQWQQQNAAMQRWAMMNNPVNQSLHSILLRLAGTTPQQVLGPGANTYDRMIGHVSLMPALMAASAMASPAQLMGGVQNLVNSGGMRVQGPEGMSWTVGQGPMQTRIAQEMFSKLMGDRPFGSNGFSNGQIGGNLLPSLMQRGAFAGMDVTLDKQGKMMNPSALEGTKDLIENSTAMLRILGETFGTQDVNVLLSTAERVTGIIASSKQNVERMQSKVRTLHDTASALGWNPAAAMKFAEASGMEMTRMFMNNGMGIEEARRSGFAANADMIKYAGIAKMDYDATRNASLAAGVYMPERAVEEFHDVKKKQFEKAITGPGARDFLAAQLLLQQRADLPPEQRKALEKQINDYGSAEDKSKWAAQMQGILRGAGTSTGGVLEAGSYGDLSPEAQDEFMKKFISTNSALDSGAGDLVKKARSLGIISDKETAKMTGITSTMLNSFTGTAIQDILAQKEYYPEWSVADYLKDNKLDQWLPEGMTAEEFDAQLTPDVAKKLKGVMAQRNLSAAASAQTSRQATGQFQGAAFANAMRKLTLGGDLNTNIGMMQSGLRGVMGYVEPNGVNAMQMALAKGAKGLLATKVNSKGGLDLNSDGAAQLMEQMRASGIDPMKALGLDSSASVEDWMARAGTKEGLLDLAKAGEGKMLMGFGISDLDQTMAETGVGVGSDGALQFDPKKYGQYADFTTKLGVFGLSQEDLSKPGGMKKLREKLEGNKLLDDNRLVTGGKGLRDGLFGEIEKHNLEGAYGPTSKGKPGDLLKRPAETVVDDYLKNPLPKLPDGAVPAEGIRTGESDLGKGKVTAAERATSNGTAPQTMTISTLNITGSIHYSGAGNPLGT